MSNIDVAVFKVLCAVGLGVTSFLGVVCPVFYVKRTGDGSSSGGGSTETPRFLPWGNCISAGLLLGVGLLHFLGECIEGAIARNRTTEESGIESGIPLAITYLLIGICIPLFIDRVVLAQLKGGHSHGHSHGIEENEGVSVTVPSTIEATATPQQTSGSDHSGKGKVFLIAVLLALHSFMEGATLGLENTIYSLRSAVVPMLLHKFFDGLILGVSVAKRLVGTFPSGSSTIATGAAGAVRAPRPQTELCSTLMRSLPMAAVLWIGVTPFVMIVTGILSGGTASKSVAENNTTGVSSSPAAQRPSMLGIAVQGIGAGSFLYIALVEIIPEEFGAIVAHRNIGSVSAERMRRFFLLVLGVAVVCLLESAGHRHQHQG